MTRIRSSVLNLRSSVGMHSVLEMLLVLTDRELQVSAGRFDSIGAAECGVQDTVLEKHGRVSER